MEVKTTNAVSAAFAVLSLLLAFACWGARGAPIRLDRQSTGIVLANTRPSTTAGDAQLTSFSCGIPCFSGGISFLVVTKTALMNRRLGLPTR